MTPEHLSPVGLAALAAAMSAAIALSACPDDPGPVLATTDVASSDVVPDAGIDSAVVYPPLVDYIAIPESVSPSALLSRASMILRGVRPSLEDLRAIAEDPSRFPSFVDAYMDSPEFGRSVRQFVTEWFELDQAPDSYPAGFPALGDLAGLGTHALNTSIIEAAGRLGEYIATEDRPWTELVTADYTMADATVATVWGLPYDDASGGWQITSYTDGRPNAGILSDGWLFTRMPSTENNRHRERASLIANALICHDYPKRPVFISPDLDLTSPTAIASALTEVDTCVSCHHSLDPLASFFTAHYGLRLPEYETGYPLQQYTPEAAAGFQPPAWYGQPGQDLGDLGRFIAEDPRFATCTVRRFYSELFHIPVPDVPLSVVATFLPALRDGGFRVKALVRAMVLSPAFAAGTPATSMDASSGMLGMRRATPQQLDTMFDDLTGFRWMADVPFDLGGGVVGTVPLMRDYLWGYRTLAGGPNNFDTTTHLRTANPTTLLVLQALAERAARTAVDRDLDGPSPVLLTQPDALLGDADAVVAQLQDLFLRLYGSEDPEGVTAAADLFQTLWTQTGGDAGRTWKLTLAALFQDARILFY